MRQVTIAAEIGGVDRTERGGLLQLSITDEPQFLRIRVCLGHDWTVCPTRGCPRGQGRAMSGGLW